MISLKNTFFYFLYLKRVRNIKLNDCVLLEKYKFPNGWHGMLNYSIQKERIKNDLFHIKSETSIYLSNKIDTYQEKLINDFIISGNHTKSIKTNELVNLKSNIIHEIHVYTPFDKHGIPLKFNEVPKQLIEMLKEIRDENINFDYRIHNNL